MNIYVAVLLTLTIALEVKIGHQYELSVSNIQDDTECPAVEVRVDDTEKSWVTDTYFDLYRGSTIARLTPTKCSSKVSTIKTSRRKCPPAETVCPSKEALLALGYKRLPGQRYYKIYAAGKSYQDAKETCENDFAHLVIVNSDAEAQALNTLIGISYGYYWAGFGDEKEEGKFITIQNQTLEEAGYSKRISSDPNGGRAENCGLYFRYATDYGLGDGTCAVPVPFICERDDV